MTPRPPTGTSDPFFDSLRDPFWDEVRRRHPDLEPVLLVPPSAPVQEEVEER